MARNGSCRVEALDGIGTAEAAAINERLARAAAGYGVAMMLGSRRALLEDPGLLPGRPARVLLLAAREDRAGEVLGAGVDQLRIAVWAVGPRGVAELGPEHLA